MAGMERELLEKQEGKAAEVHALCLVVTSLYCLLLSILLATCPILFAHSNAHACACGTCVAFSTDRRALNATVAVCSTHCFMLL